MKKLRTAQPADEHGQIDKPSLERLLRVVNEISVRIKNVEEALHRTVAKQVSMEQSTDGRHPLSILDRATEKAAAPGMSDVNGGLRDPHTLSTKRLHVFRMVKDRREITPALLAAELNLKPNTCSQYLNELAAHGYIRKFAYGRFGFDSPNDGG